MMHSDSRRVRPFSHGLAKILLAASLGLASVAVLTANAVSASASAVSKVRSAPTLAARLSARAAPPGKWSSALETPGTATLNAGLNAGVYSISCSSSGNCSAGGNYTNASAHSQAFVATETNGTWGTAAEVRGTAALNAGGNASVYSVSCSSAGNCGAGGYYTDASGNTQGFVVNESKGTWGTPSKVIDPSSVASPNAFGVETISCSASGSCSAVGDDVVASGASVGFVVSETGGTWSDANEITMTSTVGAGGSALDVISCASPGNCAAGGNGLYSDAAISGGSANIPFEVGETNGTWGTPIDYPGLATLNVGQSAFSKSISCASPGNCAAGGSYANGTGTTQAFVVNETNGTWGNAVEVPGTSSLNIGGATLDSLSCSSSRNCGAAGLYTDASGNDQAFVVSEKAGSWGNAMEVPGTSSLIIQGTGTNADSISCGSAGNCSAGGLYFDSSGNAQAFVVSEKTGTWGDVMEVPGTGTLNTAGGAFVSSISCSADSSCGAAGWYSTGSQQFQSFTSDMTALFATQATLFVTSTHGKVGTALKLVASGGSGTGAVTFAATNGSAKGCSVSGSDLKATSAGTCLVTATKAADSTYLRAPSAPTPVTMALPEKPRPLSVKFAGASSILSATAKRGLNTLSKELIANASIVVTGYAKGNATLAKSRALSVQGYLVKKLALHVAIKVNTLTAVNSATVATTKQ